jgi:integrase/recombinase XerD
MSRLRARLKDYLAMRRALGFKLKKHDIALRNFLSFLEAGGHSRITTDLALSWAKCPRDTHPAWWSERLSMVRMFTQYLSNLELRTEIPPAGLLPQNYRRPTPHIYTDSEIARLIEYTKRSLPRTDLRRYTYATLFGLLATTGIRVGEALGLDREHVDLSDGELRLGETKSKEARLVPLHPTTVSALAKYARQRDRMQSHPSSSAFFLNLYGGRLSIWMVNRTFIRFSRQIGFRGASDLRGPRIHDLRHTFAVKTLINAYKSGLPIENQVYTLSVYLGHIGPSSTYWYFSAVPELMALACARLEGKLKGGRI